ncbi:MAG: hypothetical protein HRU12_08955 [Phaeodactylibacter sp.]|nr:hypothetical protein [Phaeodactylibacter sp.]
MSNTEVDYDAIFESPRLVSEEDIDEIQKSLAPPEESSDEPTPEVGNFEEDHTPQDKGTEPEPTEEEVPEQYRGKSPQELIRMHQEATKLIGKHGQDKGQLQEKNNELSAIIDEYIQRQTPEKSTSEASQEVEEIDETLYFTDPRTAVQQELERHPTIQQAKATQVEMFKAQAKAQLMANHPDYLEVVQSPEFSSWVREVPVRQRLLMEADQQFNIESANSLIDWYKRDAGVTADLVEADSKLRVKERQEASVGSASGSAEGQTKRVYRRADIMKLMEDSETYYAVHAEDVQRAYEEDRVID